MKRVGIITLHYVDNLGGVLLAYALQHSIQRFGYESRIVDYDPTPIPSRISHLASAMWRRLHRLPIYLRDCRHYARLLVRNRGVAFPPLHQHRSVGLRKLRFNAFRNCHMKLSEQHYTSYGQLAATPPKYDAFVCGSDQVWNPYMCKPVAQPQNEPAYFLRFAEEPHRVSYAPSISIPRIPDHLRAEMTQFLQGIPHLSCREKQGAYLIKEMTGRKAEVVLDPTLLLTGEEWSRLAVSPEIDGAYILCYFLGEGAEYRQIAAQLSKKTGYRLAVISRQDRDLEGPMTMDFSDVGPAEFLGLVQHASLVCTDSFHGTLFSMNFEKPFFVFERPGSDGTRSMASRIYSILNLLGMGSRLVRLPWQIPDDPLESDYVKTRELLERERKKSLRYLETALRAATY